MQKILSKERLNSISTAVGYKNLNLLNNCKILFSSLVYQNERNLNIIKMNKDSPKFIEDWKIYTIIRSFCRTWIISGNSFRSEINLNKFANLEFYDANDVEKLYYYGKDYIRYTEDITFEIKQKYKYRRNLFILSDSFTLNEIFNIDDMKDIYSKKFIKNNDNLSAQIENYPDKLYTQKFLQNNHINIINEKLLNIEDSISFCENLTDSIPILLEIGPKSLKKLFENKENLIDLILIGIYNGELAHEFIGSEFPSINEIKFHGYDLINISEEINCAKGKLQYYTFFKIKN